MDGEMRDGSGMVDVTDKPQVRRTATATGLIRLRAETIKAISSRAVEKGDVLSTARVAALLAVKDTPRLIPMCHNIPITGIDVGLQVEGDRVQVRVTVTSLGQTGVEMEALAGASAALLTVWDMVKSLEKDATGNYPHTRIEEIKVVEKIKEVA